MPEIKTYTTQAPYSWKKYARIDVGRLTEAQKNLVVAYEVCDGGGGRCKCPARCTWAIIPRAPEVFEADESEDEAGVANVNASGMDCWEVITKANQEIANGVNRLVRDETMTAFQEANRLAVRELGSLFQRVADALEKRLQELKAQNKSRV